MNPRFVAYPNWRLSLLGTALIMACGSAPAATTDLATQPLAESSSATIPPNIMFILDDSGSMSFTYLPDVADDFRGKYGYLSSQCNSVYYDPKITYLPPLNSTGTSYPNASFTAALTNGFDSASSIFDLSSEFVANRFVPDAANTNYKSYGSYRLSSLGPYAAYYYTYSGTQTTKKYNDTGSTFYQECNSSIGSAPGNGVFTKITVSSTSGPGGADERQNFANWYSYYRTRMQTMKSSASRAFSTLTNNYRVGYMSINNNTGSDFLNITDFNATQKSSWYGKLFAATPYNGTPLRSALSTAGLIYAQKLASLNGSTVEDPIKWSCQQNFAILSTDGYWNTGNDGGCSGQDGTGCQMDRTTDIGNQDGSASKPLFDGANAVSITTATYTTEKYSTNGCSGGQKKIRSTPTTTIRTITTKPDGTLVSDVTSGPTDGSASTVVGCTPTSSIRALQSPNPSAPAVTTSSTSAGGSTNSLSDVAYYYYATDLRPAGSTGALGTDVSENNVPGIGTNAIVDDMATHQHMTTFTLGLGVNGTLAFIDGYKTSTSGDYHDIKQGSKNWPVPSAGDPTAIDDLWHAAVDGHGTYFSAKNPDSLSEGLNKALSAISISVGSGAAAATSNLEPVAGDNYVYVASYRTLQWDGDIGAYTIDLSTGKVADTPTWLAASLLNGKIESSGDSDSRTVYTYDSVGSTHLKPFAWASLAASEQAYFNTTQVTQYADWSAAEKTAATGASLVNYLRGHDRNENQDREATYGTYYRLYRDRENILGDIIHAQPNYVQTPGFNYVDDGYASFKSAQASRPGTIYVATNDGMLHALNASSGEERWAYIPQTVLPNLYKLADKNYGTNHQYYVDGAPTIGDICPTAPTTACSASEWKTVLIGGLGRGGRGYYAMDITDPINPKALWNFSSGNDGDLGYSYGKPLISKLADGTWVALVTSGYNNIPNDPASVTTGDGKGYLYVLNASTGALIRKIGTTEGSTASPSGLAQINNWVDSLDLDNTTLRVYGGDLYGNLWRFNADTGDVHKIAAFGSTQPVTVRPELGDIDSKPVIFIGTGRYLGLSDLSDTSTQSIYAIKDNLDASTLANPQSVLVQQTMTTSGSGLTRTVSNNGVDWNTQMGWYINLPDTKERVNVDPILQLGTLTIASNTPTAGDCAPGGYSWLYNFDYRTGSFISSTTGQIVANKLNYITVGLNVVKLPDGTVIIYRTGHKNPVPEVREMPVGGGAVEAKRVTWRELMN
ncbi:MAG: PilC/PilY family type IV pilus protein [Sulfuricella sp.]|nr:PilC/PilY family type IV pilus protein [Sulfuricella sp.]